MSYIVKYEDYMGYNAEKRYHSAYAAEAAIQNDLENCMEFENNFEYECIGNRTVFWVPGTEVYAAWERSWT